MKNNLIKSLTSILTVFLISAIASGKPAHIGILGFVTREMTDEKGKYIGDGRDACLFPIFTKNETGWKGQGYSADLSQFQPLPAARWWTLLNGKPQQELHLERRKTGPKVNNPQFELNCLNEDKNTKSIESLKTRNDLGLNVPVISNDKAADPDNWTRAEPPNNEIKLAKEAFVKRFEFERKCRIDEKDPPWGTIEITKNKLELKSIDVDPRSFRSKQGAFLIGLRTKEERCLTDIHSMNSFYQKHWYLVSKKGVKEIDLTEKKFSIEPLDATDFDGDGKTEWLFRQNHINAGGIESEFILFDSEFNELARANIRLEAIEKDE